MKITSESGFSLVEMAVVLLIFGLALGFSVPALLSMSQSHQLRGTTENIAAQLRMAREKAIATGIPQPMHFAGFSAREYHAHPASGVPAGGRWTLPAEISFSWIAGTSSSYTMSADGRSNTSGMVILQDRRGNRDTVSVQLSGLVLTK